MSDEAPDVVITKIRVAGATVHRMIDSDTGVVVYIVYDGMTPVGVTSQPNEG